MHNGNTGPRVVPPAVRIETCKPQKNTAHNHPQKPFRMQPFQTAALLTLTTGLAFLPALSLHTMDSLSETLTEHEAEASLSTPHAVLET